MLRQPELGAYAVHYYLLHILIPGGCTQCDVGIVMCENLRFREVRELVQDES